MLAAGTLHLSGIALLAKHLTEDNHAALLAESADKSKRAIEKVIARWFPLPDVAPTIRRLPRRAVTNVPRGTCTDSAAATARESPPAAPTQPTATTPAPAPAVVPLAAARFKVQFTADEQLKEKLERASRLMRHRVPNGDLATVVDKALDLLLLKLKQLVQRLLRNSALTRSSRSSVN